MNHRTGCVVGIMLCVLMSVSLHAQDSGKTYTGAEYQRALNQLDGKPFDPETDADISNYIVNWRESMPRHTHGSLIERDIFTKGDQLDPPRKGAVLKHMNRYVHATLEAGASTTPTRMNGEQEAFYILSGKGTVSGGGKTYDIAKGYGILIPDGMEFVMTASGDEALTMYLVNEPVPDGFVPREDIGIIDVNAAPYETSTVHWCMVFKRIFSGNDGLATIQSILTVTFAPMTMGQPHSHDNGCEETWMSLEGDINLLLGKQLRAQPPGTAFMIPPDGKTPHATINTSDKPVKLFHVARYRD